MDYQQNDGGLAAFGVAGSNTGYVLLPGRVGVGGARGTDTGIEDDCGAGDCLPLGFVDVGGAFGADLGESGDEVGV